MGYVVFFFFQAEDGIRDWSVTGVQTCALPIFGGPPGGRRARPGAVRPRARRGPPHPGLVTATAADLRRGPAEPAGRVRTRDRRGRGRTRPRRAPAPDRPRRPTTYRRPARSAAAGRA